MKGSALQQENFIRIEYCFREWLHVLGYTDSSVYNMPNYIREFLAYLEQHDILDIGDITPETVDDFFEVLRHRKNIRRGGGLSNNYLNKHLQAIKCFSTYLRETKQGGFFIDIKTFKQDRNIKDVLTIKEVQMLFEATGDNPLGLRDRAMLGIYYGCGLRRNEGIQLDIDDILFARSLIYVRKGKNHTERYVPVKSRIIQYLSDYINNGRPAFLKNKRQSGALFISARGRRIDGMTLALRLKGLRDDTGNTALIQKNIGLHTLRHSIATHLLMQGMRLERIAQFLGHKTTESTQIYAHVAAELK